MGDIKLQTMDKQEENSVYTDNCVVTDNTEDSAHRSQYVVNRRKVEAGSKGQRGSNTC